MKKVFTGIMIIVLMLSVFNIGALAKTDDMEKLLKSVEKTNAEINYMINKAVDEADKLVERYQPDICLWSMSTKADELTRHINVVVDELKIIKEANGDSQETLVGISCVNRKLMAIQSCTTCNSSCFSSVKWELDEAQQAEYNMFNEKLDKIIETLVEKTNMKAQKLIEEGMKYGIVIESEYYEVEIGGKVVMVDPLRVRGL